MIILPTDDPKVDAQREDLLDHVPGKALAQKACHILCPCASFRPVMGQVESNICGFLRGASQKNSVQETEPRVWVSAEGVEADGASAVFGWWFSGLIVFDLFFPLLKRLAVLFQFQPAIESCAFDHMNARSVSFMAVKHGFAGKLQPT